MTESPPSQQESQEDSFAQQNKPDGFVLFGIFDMAHPDYVESDKAQWERLGMRIVPTDIGFHPLLFVYRPENIFDKMTRSMKKIIRHRS